MPLKIQRVTKKQLEQSLKAWDRQVDWKNGGITRTCYNILWDIIHSEVPRSDVEVRMGKRNKIKAIYKGKALLGVIEYSYFKKDKETQKDISMIVKIGSFIQELVSLQFYIVILYRDL